MKIKSLNNLKKSGATTSLYDLTKNSYIDPSGSMGIITYQHVVEEHESGRIDLVSYYIYQSTEQVDFLLNFNNIVNPLNIPVGTIINYVDSESLGLFEYTDIEKEATDTVMRLANTNKKQRIDKNRESIINNPSLPPTLTDNMTDPVQIRGNQVIVGENLFK